MSISWFFSTFNGQALHKLLGGRNEGFYLECLSMAKEDEWDSVESASELLRGLINEGVAYKASLNNDQKEVLDDIFSQMIFEIGEGELEVKELLSEVHYGLVFSLTEKVGDTPGGALLKFLETGRRFGEVESSRCDYCIFDSAEVSEMRKEIECILSKPHDWGEEHVEAELAELLEGFKHAEERSAALFAKQA